MSSTVTEFAGVPALNYGPLTTTFTAAPSCTTAHGVKVIMQAGAMVGSPDDCAINSVDVVGCYPSGQKVSSLDSKNPPGIRYFSPGVACPSGYTTAGTMARASGAKGEEKLGAWEGTGGLAGEDLWPKDSNYPSVVPMLEVYRQIMAPEETLAICCPSGYENSNDGCYSSIGPLTALKEWNSNVCWGGTYVQATSWATPTIVVSGSITTEIISAVTTGNGAAAVTFETYATYPMSSMYEPTDIATMTVASFVPGVLLIHKASDVKNAAGTAALSPSLALLPLATVIFSVLGGARLHSR